MQSRHIFHVGINTNYYAPANLLTASSKLLTLSLMNPHPSLEQREAGGGISYRHLLTFLATTIPTFLYSLIHFEDRLSSLTVMRNRNRCTLVLAIG